MSYRSSLALLMVNSLPADTTTSLLEANELEDLLVYLKQVQRVDLMSYKRPSLLRRIPIRMQQVGAKHYQDYLNLLQQQPDEVNQLLHTVFINLTGFFRDRLVWDCLENELIPKIIANKSPTEPIRVWSAGCASGEETYSLSMLLAETLGIEQFQQRVKVYGSDVDYEAVMQARRGCYPAATVSKIPPNLLERYFERTTAGYCWRKDLRRPVIIQHDLIEDPPLPEIDLLLCRNILIYLTSEAQMRALVRFHFSLREDGFLVLGQSENLITPLQRSLFTSINRQARVFTKVPDAHRDPYLLPIAFCSKGRFSNN